MAELKTWRRSRLVSGAVMLAASLPFVARARAAARQDDAEDAHSDWPAAVVSAIADAEYRIALPEGIGSADGEFWQAPRMPAKAAIIRAVFSFMGMSSKSLPAI